MDAGGRSLKAQMRNANALGAGWALILGEDKVQNGTVVLRDLRTGSQETVAQKEIVDRLPIR